MKCEECGSENVSFKKNPMTMDHTYPLKKAREDYLKTGVKRVYTLDDVAPMCKSCNTSKYCNVGDENYRKERGRT
jgi:5-methylcytosine-specific restriction endonuclease McrA